MDDTPNPSSNSVESALSKWTMWVAIFTGALVVANIVSLYLIREQWKIAADTQSDNREQLRALVAVSHNIPVSPVNFVNNKPSDYAFSISVHNYGGTRTAHFKAWVSVKYFEGEVPNNEDFTKPYKDTPSLDVVMAPNGDNPMPPVTVSSEEVTKAVNKQGAIVLWGHADWADIFNPGQMHHISFCVSPNPVPIAVTEQAGGSPGFRPDFIFQTAPYKAECNTSD